MKLRCSCEGNALILQKMIVAFPKEPSWSVFLAKLNLLSGINHSFVFLHEKKKPQIWMKLNLEHPSVTGDTVKWGCTVVVKHHKNHHLSWQSPRTDSQFVTGELFEGSPEGLSYSSACCLLAHERKWSFSRRGKPSWNPLLVSAQIILQN